jgi:DNA-binding MarR family transcriptional regulator
MTFFDPSRLDAVIHLSRLRFMLMAALANLECGEFTFLRDLTKATDGNLGAHLLQLRKAGYVASTRRPDAGARHVTEYSLTAKGRKAFLEYVERIVSLANGSAPSSVHMPAGRARRSC